MRAPRSRTLAIMRKEFVHIRRDPRMLGTAILLPVILLLVYGYAISSDIKNVPTGIVDGSNTAVSRLFIRSLTQSGHFRVVFVSSRYGDLQDALDGRRAVVGLVIPADFASQLRRGGASVQALVDGSDPTTAAVASGYLDASVQAFSADRLEADRQRLGLGRPRGIPPVEVRVRVLYNEELKSANFIVPGLIAIVLMTLSALLTSGTLARERERGTIEQLIASPLRSHELMVGKIAAYSALCFLDVVLVVMIGTLLFGVPLRGSIILLAAASGLFLMCALGIGLLISAAIPTQQTAMTAAMMATMIPSILLSGFYFPISSMPRVIQIVTYLIPARYFMVVTRGVFLKGVGPAELWPQLLPLGVMGTVLLTASIFAFRKRL